MATGFVQRFKGKIAGSWASQFGFGTGGAPLRTSGNIPTLASFGAFGNGADTTEDTLVTTPLPANSLLNSGSQILIEAWGTFAANVNNKTVKLYFGSELVSTGVSTGSGIAWFLTLQVTKASANVQQILGEIVLGTTHGGCTYQAGAETDTAAITLKVTGTSGTAAANNIVCNGFTVTAYN